MDIRRFNHKYDFIKFCEWLAAHDMKPPMPYLLPPVGFIADNVAMGFLVETNCYIAIVDYLVTNPAAPAEDRNAALEQILNALTFYAAAHDFKILKCDTKAESIKERARARGAKDLGEYSIFWKEL